MISQRSIFVSVNDDWSIYDTRMVTLRSPFGQKCFTYEKLSNKQFMWEWLWSFASLLLLSDRVVLQWIHNEFGQVEMTHRWIYTYWWIVCYLYHYYIWVLIRTVLNSIVDLRNSWKKCLKLIEMSWIDIESEFKHSAVIFVI